MSTESLAIAVVLLLAVSAVIAAPTKKDREIEARIAVLESAQDCRKNNKSKETSRAAAVDCAGTVSAR